VPGQRRGREGDVSERINLVDLREWAELEGATSVLALVDAVEAARRNSLDGGGTNPITFELQRELDRFDFKEGGA
jgi:hypothetical protein